MLLPLESALAAEYWSLGSFKDKNNADTERSRIANETGFELLISSSGEIHRVVLEKDADAERQKSTLQAHGLTLWTVSKILLAAPIVKKCDIG